MKDGFAKQFEGMVTEETMKSLYEVQDIVAGRKPDRQEIKGDLDIMTSEKFTQKVGELVEVGRILADHISVPKVEWAKIKSSVGSFVFYHYDLVHLFLGKRFPFLEMFKAELHDPQLPPMLRVVFPGPIIAGGSGSLIYQSMLAMEKCDMADRFRRFVVQQTFPIRYTEVERARYKDKTGELLSDDYWEIFGYPRPFNIAGATFVLNLYLPAGINSTIKPATDPNSGLITLYRDKPLASVIETGTATILNGKGLA